MIDLDDLLSQIGDAPMHPALALMDEGVMAGLAGPLQVSGCH